MSAERAHGTAIVLRADLPVGRGVAERLGAAGHRVHPVVGRPGDVDALETAVQTLRSNEQFDVLVLPPPLEPQPPALPWSAAARDRIDGSLRETYFAIQRAARRMTGGRIVLGTPARAGTSPPVPTLLEAAATALVRLLAVELAPRGIALNALCPIDPHARADAVADALTFLACDEASYMTGATLPLLRDGMARSRPSDD